MNDQLVEHCLAGIDDSLGQLRSEFMSRDQLAAMAMQGLLASDAGAHNHPAARADPFWSSSPLKLAKRAYDIADAMLMHRHCCDTQNQKEDT